MLPLDMRACSMHCRFKITVMAYQRYNLMLRHRYAAVNLNLRQALVHGHCACVPVLGFDPQLNI